MADHIVARTEDIAPGDRLIVELEGKEICVFNVDGDYHALLNWCVHQGGPCCEGTLGGTYDASFDRESLELSLDWVKEDRVLSCPWHGWEYEVTSGDCLSDGSRRLPKYPISTRDGKLVIEL